MHGAGGAFALGDGRLWYNWAVVAEKTGRAGEASQGYTKASLLNPSHSDALHRLGLVLGRLKRYPEALASHMAAAMSGKSYDQGTIPGLSLIEVVRLAAIYRSRDTEVRELIDSAQHGKMRPSLN